MNERYREIFESLGWSFTEDECGNIELEKWSPAGEDFVFEVGAEDCAENVRRYADDFDVDEHIELWISGRGKRGVPSTVRELLEDAEAIDKMLDELAEALAAEEDIA